MRFNKRKRKNTPVMNMTPMIDIVFLLIIFFITVSQVSEARNEKLDLPAELAAEEQSPVKVVVNITRDGRIVIDGSDVSLPQMDQYVAGKIAAAGGAGSEQLVKVLIRADENGVSATVNDVLTHLSELNVRQVKVAVREQR